MNTLSVGDCVRMGWSIFNKRTGFFVGVTLIYCIIYVLISAVSSSFGDGAGKNVAAIVNFILGALLSMGLLSFTLKAYDSVDTAQISDLWHPRSFLKYLIAYILVGRSTLVGFMLLVIPGIIASLALMFTTYLVVDHDLGPIQAIKESSRITKGNRWNLAVLGLALVGINILGALCLIVGLLATLPITGLAMVHAYRSLAKANAIPVISPTLVSTTPQV